MPILNSTFPRRPILDGKVNFPLCLAPMVGLSHIVLRVLLREYLPTGAVTIWPTEMLNSRKLPFENLQTHPETLRESFETELVPQILGNEEEPIQKSIARLADWGAEGIDINMGCPVQKALKHNYGVALMGDPVYAAKVVGMAKRSSQLPISVKLRAGLQNDFEYLRNFVTGLVDAGADWITLHPRVAGQQRRGQADWSQIKKLRAEMQIPLVGNGDIQTHEDVVAMLNETDCDMVMAGRALAARPWMLWQVGEDLGFAPPSGRTGKAPRSRLEEGAEYGRALLRYIELAKTYFCRENGQGVMSEDLALRKFRFHVRTTSMWLPFGHTLVSISTKEKNLTDIERRLREFFNQPIEMSARTDLRQ